MGRPKDRDHSGGQAWRGVGCSRVGRGCSAWSNAEEIGERLPCSLEWLPCSLEGCFKPRLGSFSPWPECWQSEELHCLTGVKAAVTIYCLIWSAGGRWR